VEVDDFEVRMCLLSGRTSHHTPYEVPPHIGDHS
jgi:hypothetical protein